MRRSVCWIAGSAGRTVSTSPLYSAVKCSASGKEVRGKASGLAFMPRELNPPCVCAWNSAFGQSSSGLTLPQHAPNIIVRRIRNGNKAFDKTLSQGGLDGPIFTDLEQHAQQIRSQTLGKATRDDERLNGGRAKTLHDAQLCRQPRMITEGDGQHLGIDRGSVDTSRADQAD